MEVLTSPGNPQIKWAAKLMQDKKARQAEEQFVCEGEKLIRQAILAGCVPHCLFLEERLGEHLPEYESLFPRSFLVPEGLLKKICAVTSPPSQVGIFKTPTLPSLPKEASRILALDGLQDPTNVAAIIRTAHALGFQGVIATADTAELFSPKVLRGSMGAVLSLPVVQREDFEVALEEKKREGFTLYATLLREDAKRLGKVSFSKKSLIVIGNEGHGIRPEVEKICDQPLLIPMSPAFGQMQSLNAAAAAAITLWEANRELLLAEISSGR